MTGGGGSEQRKISPALRRHFVWASGSVLPWRKFEKVDRRRLLLGLGNIFAWFVCELVRIFLCTAPILLSISYAISMGLPNPKHISWATNLYLPWQHVHKWEKPTLVRSAGINGYLQEVVCPASATRIQRTFAFCNFFICTGWGNSVRKCMQCPLLAWPTRKRQYETSFCFNT